jgi:uncharacterized protein (TIGR00730 family)
VTAISGTCFSKVIVIDIRRLCVFCGSSGGLDPVHREASSQFGALLASQGIELVYGGGSVGLMGAVADAVLRSGGKVIGVIPHFLATRELLHEGVTEIRRTHDMHERKALMSELADAFVALPGGLGTFEELFEVLTWAQLGLHQKPIGLLNIAGYFNPLVAMVDRAISDGFCKEIHRQLFIVDEVPERLLSRLRNHHPPQVRKWIKSSDET